MSRPGVLTNRIKQQVRRRAKFLCEYCHTAEKWQYVPFTVDHVIPVAKGGNSDLENLALACFHCNRRKSDLVTAVDPQTDEIVPLFNPRQDEWAEHFIWSADGLTIVPLTAVGRATVTQLALNRERIIPIRADDIFVKRHPPKGDPIDN